MNGKGVVTELDGKKAKVRVTNGSECMSCPSRSYCHGDESRTHDIVVINEYGAHVSDHIVFEADTGKVIISAALIWILPIISMIAGYIIAHRFAGGFWSICAAFVFLAGSYFILKLIDTAITGGKSFYPRIVQILDTPESISEFCENHK